MTDTPEFAKIRAIAQADRRVGACDTQEIARIRAALAAGPTPGPWRTFDQFDNWCDIAQMDGGCTIGDASMEDGEYVAACNPAAMTALLAHVDEQAAEVDRLGRLIKAVQNTDAAAQQAAEIERLRADAARYTYVIDKLGPYDIISRATDYFISNLRADTPSNKDSVDKAIDEAMKEQP